MPLDPIATGEQLIATYRRYLKTLMPLRDAELRAAFIRAIDTDANLTKGPLLETTPRFRTGASIKQLVQQQILDESVLRLDGSELPVDRSLYAHQELALRKFRDGRNFVVATGTGSGKTESFMLPILSELLHEASEGALDNGVRALLLYPMNALANDQLKRMRELLRDIPDITFGRYTSETKYTEREAIENYRDLHDGQDPLPNELLSRERMRQSPPHLLLTNYAMLEYLLLRPDDLLLFSSDTWRFVVVDEAHVYDGAKAAELAMLLRRLTDRVAPSRELRYIATSATVGNDAAEVVEFAHRLFTARFELEASDPNRQDLVRIDPVETSAPALWGPVEASRLHELASSSDLESGVLELANAAGGAFSDPAEALEAEAEMAALRSRLQQGPLDFGDCDDPQDRKRLNDLVRLGQAVRHIDGSPLLSARYHLFIRATEGAFACLKAKHVKLDRHETCPQCEDVAQVRMFEMASCHRCGSTYLTGSVKKTREGLEFSPKREDGSQQDWLLVGAGIGDTDEDDGSVVESGTAVNSKIKAIKYLCPTCGALHAADSGRCGRAGCTDTELHLVSQLDSRKRIPTACAACGACSLAQIRTFDTGRYAPVSVLASTLYESLPPVVDGPSADLPGEGRKLLAFSDSRQAAAYLAPYTQLSHEQLLRRHLIWQAVVRAGTEDPVHVSDVLHHLEQLAREQRLFPRKDSPGEIKRRLATWVMAEAVSTSDRQSLEGLGMLRLVLEHDPDWPTPKPLLELGLSETEAWDLLAELVRSLRLGGAVTMPEGVNAEDDEFAPRRGPIYARKDGPTTKVLSWLPGSGSNKRLDYLKRVLQRVDPAAEPRQLLDQIWDFLTRHIRDGWLSSTTPRSKGVVHRVDYRCLRFEQARSVWRCGHCRRAAPVSVRGICPTLRCAGTLREEPLPAVEHEDDHYRLTYRSAGPPPMKVREHTAQLEVRAAAELQERFVEGEVNILSCSTTFELGVDVGKLEAVLLRNMPPTTANYLQRAGRAGRRTTAAALAVTFAQRTAHDRAQFADPAAMINGEMHAPRVPLDNERIERRHVQAVGLASFFRHAYQGYGRRWSKVGQFFLAGDRTIEELHEYLTPVPESVRVSLQGILSPLMYERLEIDTGAWVEELHELLGRVRADLENQVHELRVAEKEAKEDRKYRRAEALDRTVNTIEDRDLLGYLANRNVLPKYGFPVDTVELHTAHADDSGKLRLDRDLSSAIYEYAPGAEIVADGRLWTSAGINVVPNKEPEQQKYIVCAACERFIEQPQDPTCPACGTTLREGPKTYLIPEFGFVSEREWRNPQASPPLTTWRGRTYVSPLNQKPATAYQRAGRDGAFIEASASKRGRLIAISEGPTGGGYWICTSCGAGQNASKRPAKSHSRPRTGTECKGMMRNFRLAHRYETDILDIRISPFNHRRESWLSVLYALLEGASRALDIDRGDIDGTLYPHRDFRQGLVLFDTVPGGAGHVLEIASSLDQVLDAAREVVSDCDCGGETSCYGCLRGYRNQIFHEALSRDAAMAVLKPFGGGEQGLVFGNPLNGTETLQ